MEAVIRSNGQSCKPLELQCDQLESVFSQPEEFSADQLAIEAATGSTRLCVSVEVKLEFHSSV